MGCESEVCTLGTCPGFPGRFHGAAVNAVVVVSTSCSVG